MSTTMAAAEDREWSKFTFQVIVASILLAIILVAGMVLTTLAPDRPVRTVDIGLSGGILIFYMVMDRVVVAGFQVRFFFHVRRRIMDRELGRSIFRKATQKDWVPDPIAQLIIILFVIIAWTGATILLLIQPPPISVRQFFISYYVGIIILPLALVIFYPSSLVMDRWFTRYKVEKVQDHLSVAGIQNQQMAKKLVTDAGSFVWRRFVPNWEAADQILPIFEVLAAGGSDSEE